MTILSRLTSDVAQIFSHTRSRGRDDRHIFGDEAMGPAISLMDSPVWMYEISSAERPSSAMG
jgi:hypothetical protein